MINTKRHQEWDAWARDAVARDHLTPTQRRLVDLMSQIGFGSIEGLHVRGGKPDFDPLPQLARDVKFGSSALSHNAVAHNNFALKAEVRELFAALAEVGDGAIDRIEIRHGLPFRMIARVRLERQAES